jgi:hypothetical protein
MNVQHPWLWLSLLCCLLLPACGLVQTAQWDSFADDLGTGSQVAPSSGLFTLEGDVEVEITKAPEPEWDEDNPPDYPYAGVSMKLRRSGKAVDLSAVQRLTLEYRLQGTVDLLLVQEGIGPGSEYRLCLPEQAEYGSQSFTWQDFVQPSWVEKPTALDLTRITGFMFSSAAKEMETASLRVRQIILQEQETDTAAN